MQIKRPDFLTPKIVNNRPTEPPSSGGNFRTILKGSITHSDKTNPASKNPLQPQFALPIELTPLSVINTSDHIDKIENFISKLDSYQAKLGNTEWTLKDIATELSDLISQKEKITEIYESLSDSEGLKPILNHALIISSVEIAKFNRGDYLPS